MATCKHTLLKALGFRHNYIRPAALRHCFSRPLHTSHRLDIVKPFLLADIGEGITECQLIQWFVQPGARVEQFDKLCEVQSDKASVEITSPFDGVIKKLYYDPDDMAITGKALVDIDIQGELSLEDEEKLGGDGMGAEDSLAGGEDAAAEESLEDQEIEVEGVKDKDVHQTSDRSRSQPSQHHRPRQDHRALATPAVRHLTKELKVDITDVEGTGKDGRVLKEDVHRYASQRDQPGRSSSRTPVVTREDRQASLTPVQTQMFKAMTRSLNIPHFLYTCAADMTAITMLRQKLNATAGPEQKITHLAFIMKALSLALLRHPLLNASLNTKDPKKPELTYKGSHNFGLAIDTPSGLLVPVLRNVQDLSISAIATKMRQLSEAARTNKLSPGDFSGATFTVSNIGSVGGGVVSPVISEPQVAILGVGRSKLVPAFDANGALVKKEELVLSWSADHRVVDGAECARCAERVRTLLEEPVAMLIELQ